MEKISVIIPVYNSEKYLNDCINSVLNQTYKNIEILLIDDGSQDDSASICDEYERKYNNVICIHKNNEGAHKARLMGAIRATGKYLGFVDSDDTIEKDYYETLISYAQIGNNVADIVCSGMKILNLEIVDEYDTGLYEYEKLHEIYRTMIFDKNKRRSGLTCSLCTKLVSKDLFVKVCKDYCTHNKLWEDMGYLYKLILAANKIYVTKYVGYIYRQREDSVSHEYSHFSYIDNLKALNERVDSYNVEMDCINEQLENFRAYILLKEMTKMAENCPNYKSFINAIKMNTVEQTWECYVYKYLEQSCFTEGERSQIEYIKNKRYAYYYYKQKLYNWIMKNK